MIYYNNLNASNKRIIKIGTKIKILTVKIKTNE